MPAAALAALLLCTTAHAQPHISVKARAWIDGLQGYARGQAVTLTGTLRDDLGQPVPGARLDVAGVHVRTGSDGRFRVELKLRGEGPRALEVRFPGDTLLGATASQVEVVVGRTAVRLQIVLGGTLGAEVDAARPLAVELRLSETGGRPVAGATLRPRLDEVDLEPRFTDRRGQAELLLLDLSPGIHPLEVSWAGDSERLPARAERKIEATLPLHVELTAPEPQPAPGDPVVLEGRMFGTSPRGAMTPPKTTATLTANGAPTTRVGPSTAGRFRVVLDAGDLPRGAVTFRATAHTSTPGWRDGVSPSVTVQVPEPPPPSPWWTWAPALLAVCALGGLLLRRRPRPESRRVMPSSAPPPLPPFVFEEAPTTTGSPTLDVLVQDALSRTPLPAVLVRLPDEAPTPKPAVTEPPVGARLQADASGRARLPEGGRRLWVCAPGYAPVCHPLPTGPGLARVHLTPLRARLQQLYAEVLRAAGSPPIRFGKETPREARRPLEARGAPEDALSRLTTVVERACFGARAPRPADLALALTLAAEVRRALEAT